MDIAFIMPKQTADVLIKQAKDCADNLKMDNYESLDKFIIACNQRQIVYDRVIATGKTIPESQFSDLVSYWVDYAQSTQIILLGNKRAHKDAAVHFTDMFPNDNILYLLPDNVTVSVLRDLIVETMPYLRQKYGIVDVKVAETNTGVSIDESVMQMPEEQTVEEVPQETIEEVKPQVVEPVVPQEQVQPVEEPKKKRGLFGLFSGKGKGKTVEPQEPVQPVQSVEEIPPQQIENNDDFGFGDSIAEGTVEQPTEVGFEEFEEVSESEFSQVSNGGTGFDNPVGDGFEEVDGFGESMGIQGGFTDGDMGNAFGQDDFDAFGSEQNNGNPTDFEEVDATEFEEVPETNISQSVPFPTEAPEEVAPVSMGNYKDFTQNKPVKENVEEVGEVNLDFSEDLFGDQEESTEEVVDLDASLSSIGQAEDTFRQKADQPKTIIKEVERIVEVSTSNGKDFIKALAKGKRHVTVVVTGDRGSGITSTVRLIAEKTANLGVDTLIIDLDTQLHGFLSYLNYDDYATCGDQITRGVKGVRSARYLANSIYELSKNLGVITANYDVEVTDDDIKNAQDIIAESIDDFSLILVDCPLEKLPLIPDLISSGTVCVCVETSRRGFMNFLCRMEDLDLGMKYKKKIAQNGKLLLTKITKSQSPDKVLKSISSIYEADDVDWMRMRHLAFDGKLDNKALEQILGG